MATIYQVAELAGVSLSTVSRVINGRKTVNPELREKVEQAMRKLNYRPNSVARSLASSRSDSVGLLISELDTPFFGEMMQAVEATLRAANKHVIITVGHNNPEQELDGLEFLISRNCDALIMHVEALSDDQLRQINQDRIPIALVNRVVEGLESHCITLDNEMGGYLATRHLIDLGHTQIACIAGPGNKQDAVKRLEGHKRALKEVGLPFKASLVYEGDYTEVEGVNGFKWLSRKTANFTALVCANDWMASGAISAAREAGLSLPEDLSIIGFDNVLFAHHLFPKLTTIKNPIYQMGEMAASAVLQRVYRQKVVVQNTFIPELVERDSAIPWVQK
ncbi:LacI family DNA-binding transcriptional regulator [Alteromonas aestuariivivens]|uniref:LacI family DNA-binding transcriptional regulator n=1 Tax=Alteromonas aestuariivivens TaxID=1938339 RepID=A0A3D8M9V9_9ALTE|nr:LacI family DNA-binding transcriptional regulator [Alteromonas aestuariivivens]RDV26807.1 LacI family DNA-binding transcriptional regulator [Alteromonas aestuariivivens]